MKNRLLTFAALAIFGCHTVMAQKVTIDGLTYKLQKNGTAYVCDADPNIEKAIIKSSVNYKEKEYKVTEIGHGTMLFTIPFHRLKKLTSVSIPNSVTRICGHAFVGCTSLTELIVPDHPIDIKSNRGEAAFAECTSITTVKCQNGNNPLWMVQALPEESPFAVSAKYPQPQQQVVYVQAPQPQQSHPVQPVAQEKPKAPTSDVDTDIPTIGGENSNTFAVIIANENYQEEVKVDYALNDGETFKQYCMKILGLPEKNIHIRKDATLNNMKAEISWLKQVAEAYGGEARLIVFYAGHGIPDEKSGTSYLLPVDGKGTMLETGYSLQKFYEQLGKMPSQGVTVFMDACFSGSQRGDGMLAAARGVAIKAKPQAPQGKMVVFSAAQGDETAYPYKEKEHGLFTYYLLKKLKETRGNVSLEELGNYVTTQVKRESIVSNGKSQTPSVSTSSSVSDTWKNLKLK